MRALLILTGAVALASCSKAKEEDLSRRLSESTDKVLACNKQVNELKNEVSGLKRQLAQAMANPSKVVLTDPDIINLIASIKGGPVEVGKGGLDPRDASRVVNQGARAMQMCYERALKKNQALQYQAGVGLTLDITVRPAGSVETVQLSPAIDQDFSACIKTAAMRWKFPAFQGESIVISQKVTLTPKT
jgi:hypothetical protein